MSSRKELRPKSVPELPDKYLIPAAILKAAKQLARALEHPPAATAVQFGDGITLACPAEVTLYALERGFESEYDFPFGDTAAQVSQKAKDDAEGEAKGNVVKDLNRQVALINCADDCKKEVAEIKVDVVPGTTKVAVKFDPFKLADQYLAESTAEGTVTVKCKRR